MRRYVSPMYELTAILEKMYNIEIDKYFSNIYKFLKNKDDNRISLTKTLLYIVIIFFIVFIGQVIANNSQPFKSDNIENKKFIKAEINRQVIIDTFSVPMEQSCFKSYFTIKLKDESTYRLNLGMKEIDGIIKKNTTIQKKANDKTFEITNNNKTYFFVIEELNNFEIKLFILLGSLFFSIIGIPLWLKQNELEKEIEKNSR